MAILWMEGWDHYGEDDTLSRLATARALNGVWAYMDPQGVDGGIKPVGRTGTYAYQDSGNSGLASRDRIRRVFGGAKIESGVGFALYQQALQDASDEFDWEFRDVDNNPLVTFTQDTTGVVRIYQGTPHGTSPGPLLADSGVPVLVADAWQWVEMFVAIDDVYGYAEIRVDGQTAAVAVDVDLGTVGSAQFAIQNRNPFSPLWAVDDMVAWDTTGSFNNDFIGDSRVRLLLPNGDTTEADWVPVGPTLGYDAINDTTPDDASSYIESAPVTPPVEAISDFELQNVPIDVASILACQTYVRMRKSQAGDCDIQVGLVSAGDVALGTDRPITEAWTYWMDVFETDPDTGALWTPAALDAAQLRIKRTL